MPRVKYKRDELVAIERALSKKVSDLDGGIVVLPAQKPYNDALERTRKHLERLVAAENREQQESLNEELRQERTNGDLDSLMGHVHSGRAS